MSSSVRLIFPLILFVLFSHVLLLLNSGHYWDGWIPYILIQKQDWGSLREFWKQSGQPQVYYLYYGLSALSPNFTACYRIVIVLCMMVIALSIHSLCIKVMKLPVVESGFIAAFVATWPFYNVFISEAFPHYVTSLALFYSGWALYFRGIELRKRLYVCLAFLLIGISSFTINSLIIFYYGFVLLGFFCTAPIENADQSYSDIGLKHSGLFLRRKWFLIIFPVFVFIIKSIFFRPYGMYEGYNKLIFSERSLADTLLYTIYYSDITLFSIARIIDNFKIAVVSEWPVVLLALAVISIMIRGWKSNAIPQDEYRHISILSGLGFVFLILAIVPYAMVGKYVYFGWGERHGILMALGLAFLLTSLCLKLRQIGATKLSTTIYALFLLINCSALNHCYLMLQARGLLDQSVVQGLSTITPPPVNTLVLYSAPVNYLPAYYKSYESYELSGMFYSAWGQEKWYAFPQAGNVIDAATYLPSYLKLANNDFRKKVEFVSDYTPGDCVALLKVQPNDSRLSSNSALKGYYYRRLFAPSETAQYVKGLFTPHITYPNDHCKP